MSYPLTSKINKQAKKKAIKLNFQISIQNKNNLENNN